MLPEMFLTFSMDQFQDGKALPWDRIASGEFPWPEHREAFFQGIHNCIPALAAAGNNMLVQHIIETSAWLDRLLELLDGFDVFFVGVHCPLEELQRRELARGDRRTGGARTDFETCHTFGEYDFEVDGTQPAEDNARLIVNAWQSRSYPLAFERMRAKG